MNARRIASEVTGLIGLAAWLIVAGVSATWRKASETYAGQLIIIAIICGALGVGLALAF